MEVQDHEIDAWFGRFADRMTETERAEFRRLVRAYHATQAGRGGEPGDYAEQDNAAWVAAFEYVVGELDVATRGRAYREARDRAYAGAMIAVLAGAASEVQAARDATISRNTLRGLLRKSR